ncbi:MAG: CHAT domain-containing protein [Polyangia bacterium]
MRARDLLSHEFVTLDAGWSAERALAFLLGMPVRWVVVRRRDAAQDGVRYHALLREQALLRLRHTQARDVLEALALQQAAASPLLQGWQHPERGPAACVVLEEGRVLGVLPAADAGRFGEVTRSGEISLPHIQLDSGLLRGRGLPLGFQIPDPEPEPPGRLRRYLEAQLRPRARVGEAVPLLVSLRAAAGGGASSGPFATVEGARIQVMVHALEGLSLTGPAVAPLLVRTPQPEEPARFELHADREGPGRAQILALYEGTCFAALEVDVHIEGQVAIDLELTEPGQKVRLELPARSPPDLSLAVLENDRTLSFYLTSADGKYTMQEMGSTVLTASPREHFREFFGRIERLPLETEEQRQIAEQKLAARGSTLCRQVLPPALRKLLWELRARIRTVQITSDEPWIPWEMCRLESSDPDATEDGLFLCEAFSVCRWLFRAQPDVDRLALSDLALIVPAEADLPSAQDEKQFLLSLAGAQRHVTPIPASYLQVVKELSQGRHDAWHFTGHAAADDTGDANRAALLLDQREELTPEDASSCVRKAVRTRPFVFLNACQSGRAGLSLTDSGGWAQCFLRSGPEDAGGLARGASAFIGTYFSVSDTVATVFARALYTDLLAGRPIGEAAKAARAAARKAAPGDPTWLAYTVYADPNGRVHDVPT